MKSCLFTAATTVAVLVLGTTALAADPAVKCESAKLDKAGKYASCRLKAESKAVKSGDSPDYSKCSLDKFTDLEVKATEAGGSCPSQTDHVVVRTYIDGCASRVTTWLHGGGGLPDTCASDLETCGDDLATSDADLAACQAEAHGQIPTTGQTTCYNAAGTVISCTGSGQDGELQKGLARSFTDHGDGTISDNGTGLMWERLDDNNNFSDYMNLNGIHDGSYSYFWADAFTKVNTLNSLNFAGHSDWRLPNVMELLSLAKFGGVPATYPIFSSNCVPGCTVATCSCGTGLAWSSTSHDYTTSTAWVVGFGGEVIVQPLAKGNTASVRAVRGGS